MNTGQFHFFKIKNVTSVVALYVLLTIKLYTSSICTVIC